jgi:hypothetical protein
VAKQVKATTKRSRVTARKSNGAAGAPRPPAPPPDPVAPASEALLDGAVESLRRLLSELLEQRLDTVARDLADVRRALVSGAGPDEALALVDTLLERLGAVRFAATPHDLVDPLIHTVVEERRAPGVPRGVIVAAVRPGFRTDRGVVLARAAVAVSAG